MVSVRRLYLVFGDQLDPFSTLLKEADPDRDAFWMAEAAEEAEWIWSHRRRLAFFFSAMRHYSGALQEKGFTVHYTALREDGRHDRGRGLGDVLGADLRRLKPQEVVAVEPGDHRIASLAESACRDGDVSLRWVSDSHFLLPLGEFREWATGRKRFLLEDFYRMMRKKTGILIDDKGEPEGGSWNYDRENRESFGTGGPPEKVAFGGEAPDRVTKEVLQMVRSRFGKHPGRLEDFDLPVTRAGALAELDRFVGERLPFFGRFQDAMWEGEDTLYHSRLSAVLNVKLLHPREVLDAALEAWRARRVPLNALEGFVRQILGWREFVRGVYHYFGDAYLDRNELDANADLPAFFWNGETRMHCVRDAMRNVLRNGYAHHIQRLMVLGQFALLWGAHPRRFHEWHLAMYCDAIDWSSAPNTIGMSQFADGGVVGTKPYCASGNYINRMSNHCAGCAYQPKKASGDDACPFTTLYYDFLDRHRERFKENRRMTFQLRNLRSKKPPEMEAIRARAQWLREAREI